MSRNTINRRAAFAALLTAASAVLTVGTAATAARACDECQLRKKGTYMGQFTIMGNGTARTWVTFDQSGKPAAMGVTLSENALTGLPTELPSGMRMWESNLKLPNEAAVIGVDHVSLGWNPMGHEPAGIYDKPHFDFHFFLMSREERKKITAEGEDKKRAIKQPTAGFMPAGYILPPDTAVPDMGGHAIDPTGPELQGKEFTSTFIYGYYNGRMNFIEPMITQSFIQSVATMPEGFTAEIKQPASFTKRGYYPTRYSIRFDAVRREYTVALEGLTLREISQPGKKAARTAAVKR